MVDWRDLIAEKCPIGLSFVGKRQARKIISAERRCTARTAAGHSLLPLRVARSRSAQSLSILSACFPPVPSLRLAEDAFRLTRPHLLPCTDRFRLFYRRADCAAPLKWPERTRKRQKKAKRSLTLSPAMSGPLACFFVEQRPCAASCVMAACCFFGQVGSPRCDGLALDITSPRGGS